MSFQSSIYISFTFLHLSPIVISNPAIFLIFSVCLLSLCTAMPFSRSFLSEDQLLCSICLDVFDNPVSTPCGHSFCMTCIGHYWDSVKHYQCPLCKQTFKRKPDLHINRTLREITEQFKRMKENPGPLEGTGAGRDAEEGVRNHDSVDGTVRPGQLPDFILEDMKQRLTRHRAHSNSLTSHQ